MDGRLEDYLRALRDTPLEEHTEHTGRAALQALLNRFAADASKRDVRVQHEPKREADKGAPDFKVKSQGMILGYVEVKKVGSSLDQVLKSEQIKRYRTLSDNILLTDYLQWIWIDREGVRGRESLAYPTDLEDRKLRIAPERAEAVAQLITNFFSKPPQGIGQSEQLALALAARSRLLRDYLGEELVRQEREHKEGRLYGLFQVFRDQVFHELTLHEFADAFAQMLAYGLFLARLNSDSEPVTLNNAREHVPGSFRLIRELVDFLSVLGQAQYKTIAWVVDEVLSIVNGLRLADIHQDLSFRQRKAVSRKVRAADEEEHRLFERDPFIYFYEDYLKAYDKEMRKSRGVYYTPPPVVNFIVRAVDDILKGDGFGIADGLADHRRVTVLDFACGTGTFLLEVFERAFDNIGGAEAGRAEPTVREHFLKNIFGFEYLIAPYTVAHLKLSQYLKDKGHPLLDGDRLQVFLTNTLEPIEPQRHLLLPAVTAEVKAAQAVKDRDILVITGNPPYSGHSKNKGKWISAALKPYRIVDGKPLSEKNPKWLQDDYVKFIRFAQMKMDAIDEGVVGIITNHSYVDNPTFRGMRQSLVGSFDQIYIFDLHGSTKPKELAPDGVENKNVFDIQKGVAITLFVKRAGAPKGIWYAELWGSRIQKYKALADAKVHQIEWQEVPFFEPYYMFRRLDWTGWEEYRLGWQIADSLNPTSEKSQIFAVNVLGFQTHRDHFAIAFERDQIESRTREMCDDSIPDEALREAHGLKDNRDWKLSSARKSMRSMPDRNSNVIDCSYRPFDERSCFFGYEFMDYPRRELIEHVAGRSNLQLLVSRQIGTARWQHVFCVDEPAESCCIADGSTEQNYCFPLWLYRGDAERTENLSAEFRAYIDARYEHLYTPEEVLGYVYAIMHAPTYRSRYAEFLRIDFPRVRFPESAKSFEALSELGWALVQAHLLREVPREGLADYHGKGDHAVDAVRYSPGEDAVWINKTQCFRPVPRDVWEFHIGGYQVLEKYLKSRKGRTLSLDEITHVAAVADSLAFTIDQMARIDAAYRAAFPDGDN